MDDLGVAQRESGVARAIEFDAGPIRKGAFGAFVGAVTGVDFGAGVTSESIKAEALLERHRTADVERFVVAQAHISCIGAGTQVELYPQVFGKCVTKIDVAGRLAVGMAVILDVKGAEFGADIRCAFGPFGRLYTSD